MKYFKHACNASDREFLQSVLEHFGAEGYVLWFQILETLGQEIEKEIENFKRGLSNTIRARMTIGISFLIKRARMCKCEKNCSEALRVASKRAPARPDVPQRAPACPERASAFIQFAKKKGKYAQVRFRRERDEITLECPNFLDNMDEYTRKSIKECCEKRGISPDSVLIVSGVDPESIRLIQQQQTNSPPLTPLHSIPPVGDLKLPPPATASPDRPPSAVLDKAEYRRGLLLLSGVALNKDVAARAAEKLTLRRLVEVVKASDGKDNPGGWVRSALMDGWEVPAVPTDEAEKFLLHAVSEAKKVKV